MTAISSWGSRVKQFCRMSKIEIRNLCKRFARVKALDDVSLDIEAGEIFGLAGSDGSGRTTMFRILATLSEADSGTVSVNGHDALADRAYVRKVTAYVTGTFSLYPDLTVKENIEFFASLNDSSIEECYEYIEPIYRKLLPFSDRRSGKLSGGMKQKLSLCCALVRRPEILLLDEPTTGIDVVSRGEVWEAIHYLNEKLGITVIVASPYRNELLQCDRVALLEKGSVKAIGKPGTLVPQDEKNDRSKDYLKDVYAVDVRNLTKKFGDFTAVDSISFNVREGEIFGFLGSNGAGKTTSIRMLCGLLTPSSGDGKVAGYDIISQGEKIKRMIGYMSQKFLLYPDLTVEENLSYLARIYGMSRSLSRIRVKESLEAVGLTGMENRKSADLPLGLKQKLSFAASIIHSPSILLLDEPTSGVDAENCRQMWNIIDQTAKCGTTVFVTTHNMDEAWHCDRILVMSQGKIKAIGEPEALVAGYAAKDINDLFSKLI